MGAGIYDSVQSACDKAIKIDKTCAPIKENEEAYKKFYAVYNSLYGHLKDDFKTLGE